MHKVETRCSTNDITIATVETIAIKSSCLVTLISSETTSDQALKILLRSESRTFAGVYNREREFEIRVHSGDILNLEEFSDERITLFPYKRTIMISLRDPHLIGNMELSSPNPNLIKLDKEDDNILRITIPESIEDDFETSITIKDVSIGETQKIKVAFISKPSVFFNFSLWDVLLFVLFLIVLLILYLWYIGDEEEVSKSKRSYISRPGELRGSLRMSQQ